MKVSIQEDMYDVIARMPEDQGDRLLRSLVTYGFTGEEPEPCGDPWYFVFLAFKGRIEMSANRSRSNKSAADARWERERTARDDASGAVARPATDASCTTAPMHDASGCMSKTTHDAEYESESEKEDEGESESEKTTLPPGTDDVPVDELSTPAVTVRGMAGIEGSGKGRVPLACMRRRADGKAWYGSDDGTVFLTQVEALADRYRAVTGRDDFKTFVRRLDGLCPAGCRGDPEQAAQCFELVSQAIDRWDSRKAPRGPYGLAKAMLADREVGMRA